MRLQLTSRVAVALLLTGCAARTRDISVDARTSQYEDDDATSINTTAIAARAPVGETVTVKARWLADVVSSASVDVVSAATGRWNEVRTEGEASVAYDDGTRRGSIGYIRSIENDWWSHNAAIGGSHDFLEHNLTLGVGFSYQDNLVGRAEDANFEERLVLGGASGSVTAVLTPDDIVEWSYGVQVLDGYQASPYRLVRFEDPSAPGEEIGQDESLPDRRTRHAITTRWNHHLLRDTVFRTHVRVYTDDWGVGSFTGGTEWVQGWSGGIETGFFVRGYTQSGAVFYEDGYDRRRRFMTSDRELSAFHDVFAGSRIAWERKRFHAELKLTGFFFAFSEFERLPRRQGFVGEAAIGAKF